MPLTTSVWLPLGDQRQELSKETSPLKNAAACVKGRRSAGLGGAGVMHCSCTQHKTYSTTSPIAGALALRTSYQPADSNCGSILAS
jgi:hypothetical protein